jgi:hypothetical protein
MITKEDIDWIKKNKGDDVGFIFYSGDVLQDTAMLSTKTKGVYMSIMCLHMKNICFSKQQICSFCEVLNDQEIETLFLVLKEIEGCFFIEWVLESIKKRREYSISRSNNRSKKEDKPKKKISKTYDKHMVNENEIVNENKKAFKSELEKTFEDFLEMRKKIKKPATAKAIELLKNKIRKLSNGDEQKAIELIEQSIRNSWQDIFDIRQSYSKPTQETQKAEMHDAFLNASITMREQVAKKWNVNH